MSDPTNNPDRQRTALEADLRRHADTIAAVPAGEAANPAEILRRQLAALVDPPKPPAIASVVMTNWQLIDQALQLLARDGKADGA